MFENGDSDTDGDLLLFVESHVGVAEHVNGETVAEYNDCDSSEPVYECADISGWAVSDKLRTEDYDEVRNEIADLVSEFDCRTYTYPESRLDCN